MWQTPDRSFHHPSSPFFSPTSPYTPIVFKRKYPGLQGRFEDEAGDDVGISRLLLPSLDEEMWWNQLSDEQQVEVLEHEAEMAKANAEFLKKRFKAKFGKSARISKGRKTSRRVSKGCKTSRRVSKGRKTSRQVSKGRKTSRRVSKGRKT